MKTPPGLLDCPVVILAGGLGTRLHDVISDRPKSLAPVAGRPFLEIQIALLRDQGARRFVLCVGHRAEQIRDFLGDGSRMGIHIDYSVEPEKLLGTAGALRLAERYFEPRALVLNGDTFLAADYSRLLAHHAGERAGAAVVATVTLARLEKNQRYGSVRFDSTRRYLSSFKEKEPDAEAQGWLNAGAYVLERELIERIPPGVACSLEHETFPLALGDGLRIAAYPIHQPFFDIGTGEDFHRFCRLYAEGAA